jgi:hypothetical protein
MPRKIILYVISKEIPFHNGEPSHLPTCDNTNVPLSITIKSDTAPCHFVSTSYTDNSLEYSVVKILYTNNSAYKIKSTQVRNHQYRVGEGVGLLLGATDVNDGYGT